MTLAPAERLLALLVRAPDGVSRDEASGLLGRDPEPVLAVLAERGHRLAAVAGGWRLECARSHFDPGAFETARRGDFGRTMEVWESTGSTNDLARAASERGAPAGSVWLAEHQAHGRGRQGRVWECAPHAGLLVSVLVDLPASPPEPTTLLSLAIGLGCCEALRQETGCDVRPKWPNDLWVEGSKVAGLLVEISTRAARGVIGLGVNVRPGAAPPDFPSAALEDRGPVPPREALLVALLEGIEQRYRSWCSGADPALVARYSELEITLGRRVRAAVGQQTVVGVARRLNPAGLLCVETDSGGTRELAAGEVHLL